MIDHFITIRPSPGKERGRGEAALSFLYEHYFIIIIMKKIHNLREFKERRRELRRNSTFQEKKLWFILRGRKLGHRFHRQHSIRYYVADFYCPEKKLIIEIDGSIHSETESKLYDIQRDDFLTELGYKILRIKNGEIDENINGVVKQIKKYIDLL
jgi:very-short-patch-repair endonuclease